MISYKYIVLCIIFLVLIPCKIIFSQDIFSYEIESDTAVQSELDIKYDSALAKAASSLTASAFQQSINYYKEASALKPGETYPYKMISYVKELEIQKKRSDDLKRKAQIRDDLIRANQAIVDKSWNQAKALFNEILTLHPQKTDEDYAKSKIEAIDLELKRIALRTPVKVAPPVVIPPRNRREARAQRKLAERNAIIASAANRAKAPKQTEAIKASSAHLASVKNDNKKVAASTRSPEEISQQQTEALLPDKKVDAATHLPEEISQQPTKASLPDKKVAVATAWPQEISQRSTEELLPDTIFGAATPLPKEISQRSTEALLPDTIFGAATPSPKEISQQPTKTSLPDKKVAVATPFPKEISQQPTKASLPEKKFAVSTPLPKEISQRSTEVSLPDKKVAVSTPLPKEISPRSTEALLPDTIASAATPSTKEISQQPTEASLQDRKVAVSTPSTKKVLQKPTEALLPDRKAAVSTPSTKKVLQKPTEGLLPDRKVAVSTPSTTEISPVAAPFAEKKEDKLMAPTEKMEENSTGVPLLNLVDSSNYVKLICQDISFIGTNAYIKVLVQNNSDSINFLTDTLQVSIKKNNGAVKKLDQRFISNFPVIRPQNELVLVYFADASIAVDPDDIFILQMEDKLKQTKLMIQVPWSLYKQQKSF